MDSISDRATSLESDPDRLAYPGRNIYSGNVVMWKRSILLLSLVFIAVPGWAACTGLCVQSNYAGNPGVGTTLNAAFTSNQTAGHLNIVSLSWCSGSACNNPTDQQTCAITDDHGQTYGKAIWNPGSGINFSALATCEFYFVNTAADSATSNTVHATITDADGAGVYYLNANISEWNLPSSTTLEALGMADGNSASASVSTSTATARTGIPITITPFTIGIGDLVYSHVFSLNTPVVVTTGDTQVAGSDGTVFRTAAATGIQTTAWTFPSGPWKADILVFNHLAATGSSPSLSLLGVGK